MGDVYEHLENYEDVNKLDEIKLENKELKNKIEEYSIGIAKLQKDFDKLSEEHRKLEHNYSSLLKTARAEIERKTQMIQQLNIEKDKLIINERQNRIKGNNRFKRSENIKSKNTKGSDSSLQEQSEEAASKLHNSKAYCKNENASTAHSLTNGKPDSNITSDVERKNLNSNNHSLKNYSIPKKYDVQVLKKLDNSQDTTKHKKITDRRKSMPVLSNEIKFSSEEDCENSTESRVSKKNYQTEGEVVKRLAESNYNRNRISESSSAENYARHHEPPSDNYSKNHTSRNQSRDKYESSYRKREKYSPERSYYRGADNYGDDYYQRYDYGSRRSYRSPPRDKSYHSSRSRDRRSNYDRDCSRDYIRNRNDDERCVEKHKLFDEYDEPSFKRQKFEHGYRYTQDYNRWQKEQDYSARTAYSPLELREQYSCRSPDHVPNDYFIPTDPIKEIKYTATVPLEDPRLTTKKYKIVRCSDKEFITTVNGRNVDLFYVNKRWNYKPVPMPKLLLEPPQGFLENINETVHSHNESTCNLGKKTSPSCKGFNRSEDPQKNNVMAGDSSSLLKQMQKSALDTKILTDEPVCKDSQNNRETINDKKRNAGSAVGVNSKTVTDKTIGEHIDEIVKNNLFENTSVDVLKEILRESSKNNSSQEPKSMPKLNLNPESSKEINNFDKEISQKRSEASLGSIVKNTNTEDTIGSQMDKIIKGRGCKNSDVDIERKIENNLKEGSKNNLTKGLNSMPNLNLNPVSSREDNHVDKVMIQPNNDIKNNKVNNIEDEQHYNFDVVTNIVEDDLILSDETSDAFDTDQKSFKKDTTAKLKKKKGLKICNKNVSDKVIKPDGLVEKKQRVIKDKETSPEQSKKHKSKKKLENKATDLDQSKASKTKKNKREKDTKTQDIKSKFSDLFGDSNSLMNPEDLGIDTHENEISNNYDAIFEDTEAAVDLNLKDIEKNQTSRTSCQNGQNDNEKIFLETNMTKVDPHSAIIKDNCEENKELQLNTIIHDNEVKEAKHSVVEDTVSLPNINGNIDEAKSDVVETIIISTGIQPQIVIEDENLKDVERFTEKPIEVVELNALATSTPAKIYADNTISEPIIPSKTQACSNNTSPTSSKDLSTPIDQPSATQIDSQKSEDVPDVRIFVKRRRKVKK